MILRFAWRDLRPLMGGAIARTVLTGIAMVALLITSSAQSPSGTNQYQLGSLQRLAHQTGWIPIGVLTSDSSAWAIGMNPAVPYPDLTGSFTFVDKSVDARLPILPEAGDRIRLTVDVPVFILDFKETGEARRMDPPLRGLADEDKVGFRLPPNTVLRVEAVSVIVVPNGLRSAFTRVAPDGP
jgi:hypothetical protein